MSVRFPTFPIIGTCLGKVCDVIEIQFHQVMGEPEMKPDKGEYVKAICEELLKVRLMLQFVIQSWLPARQLSVDRPFQIWLRISGGISGGESLRLSQAPL